ncbi:hypothetical protein [Pseudomonas vranovensis]|uniref:hypothetical protein n=1 Tax=Pseudomonas vranovensis TaxID=321661 RepID=UPI003D97A37A
MNKPVWFCQEFGEAGFVLVAADLQLSDGTLIGLRQALHPFDADEDPQLVPRTVSKMNEIMGRMSAQTVPASRACAFGAVQGGQDEAIRA